MWRSCHRCPHDPSALAVPGHNGQRLNLSISLRLLAWGGGSEMTGCQPSPWEPVWKGLGGEYPARFVRRLAEFPAQAAAVHSAVHPHLFSRRSSLMTWFPFLSLFSSPLPVFPGITSPTNYLETFGASGEILTKIEIVNWSSLFIQELKMVSLKGLPWHPPPCFGRAAWFMGS